MKTIQQLRVERGESRMELADALGVTLDEVSAWELGEAEPGLSAFRALTQHFGVAENDLDVQAPSGSDE